MAAKSESERSDLNAGVDQGGYEKLPPRAAFQKDKTQGTPPITVQFRG